nr:MMPL family transporter [Micromonospora sp. DSM 115978]
EATEVLDTVYGAAAPAEQAGLQVEVGGQIAENISEISGVAELIGIGVALVILLFAFGSIVAAGVPLAVALVALGVGSSGVALIAATMNVSTIAPTLGTMVGLGVGIDYALLLVTRHVEGLRAGLSVREAAGLATGDAHGSVVRGLSATGRVITSAALIMIAVFAGFALDPDVTVKMIGVGMAVAVLVDATIIRMILVPATMALLGRANWWLPGWLDRVLPHLDVHGEAADVARTAHAGPTPTPTPVTVTGTGSAAVAVTPSVPSPKVTHDRSDDALIG